MRPEATPAQRFGRSVPLDKACRAEGVRYPVSELAARYGASVGQETSDLAQA
jgi:hypothetical protein